MPGVEPVKRTFRRCVRAVLSWASLLAIPCGVVVGLQGFRTLGALFVLGGTLAYFLVDPIILLLDSIPSEQRSRRR